MPRTPVPSGLEPGAVAIPGFVSWIQRIRGIPATRNLSVWVGMVEAAHEVFGNPVCPDDPRVAAGTAFAPDSLRFEFWSLSEFYAGQSCAFDVMAGDFGSYAQNVQAAETDEDEARATIRFCNANHLVDFSARLNEVLQQL